MKRINLHYRVLHENLDDLYQLYLKLIKSYGTYHRAQLLDLLTTLPNKKQTFQIQISLAFLLPCFPFDSL